MTVRGDVRIRTDNDNKTQVINPKVLKTQEPVVHAWLSKRIDRVYTSSDIKRLGRLKGRLLILTGP